MAKKRHTPEQVINKMREAEGAIAEGSTVAEAARWIGVTEQTFYRWRSEYGGLRIDQARRLKRLESENSRLKRAVADLTLDNQILREASGETSESFTLSPVCRPREGALWRLGATRLQGAGSSSLHTAIQAKPCGR